MNHHSQPSVGPNGINKSNDTERTFQLVGMSFFSTPSSFTKIFHKKFYFQSTLICNCVPTCRQSQAFWSAGRRSGRVAAENRTAWRPCTTAHLPLGVLLPQRQPICPITLKPAYFHIFFGKSQNPNSHFPIPIFFENFSEKYNHFRFSG